MIHRNLSKEDRSSYVMFSWWSKHTSGTGGEEKPWSILGSSLSSSCVSLILSSWECILVLGSFIPTSRPELITFLSLYFCLHHSMHLALELTFFPVILQADWCACACWAFWRPCNYQSEWLDLGKWFCHRLKVRHSYPTHLLPKPLHKLLLNFCRHLQNRLETPIQAMTLKLRTIFGENKRKYGTQIDLRLTRSTTIGRKPPKTVSVLSCLTAFGFAACTQWIYE